MKRKLEALYTQGFGLITSVLQFEMLGQDRQIHIVHLSGFTSLKAAQPLLGRTTISLGSQNRTEGHSAINLCSVVEPFK